MNASLPEIEKPALSEEALPDSTTTCASPAISRRQRWNFLALPVAAVVALAVHLGLPHNELAADARLYSIFLGGVLGSAIVLTVIRSFWRPLEAWLGETGPIVAAAVLLLGMWEIITSVLHLLPLPYFPGPAAVLQSLVSDRGLLIDSTWHSLVLLVSGYLIGVVVALITGICIGWSPRLRYWCMPVLKVVGPIPATAWIPLVMVLSSNFGTGLASLLGDPTFPGKLAAISLIALAVWFPVTMLTATGISNTRASYLDVARTLGAGRTYLIFRVAIPAAMPSIFIGLFMGLGTSFLTLIVAETVGVKSGLGWYINWAQGWAEYGKVFAALIIMAAFFSTIMTVLFKVRDRLLVWQKGVIKW